MTTIPPLTRDCNSWVVTPPAGRAIELFTLRNVEKAAAAGWRIETASDYLYGFDVVCTIEGDAADRASHMRAEAICLALDKQLRLARNQP